MSSSAPTAADPFGNAVTAAPEAAAAVRAFVSDFLAYRQSAAEVVAVADRHPECVLLNAYAGMLWMLLEAPEAAGHARCYLERARAGVHRVTAREAQSIALLAAWIADDVPQVLAISEAILREHPRDLLTAKIAHYHQFNGGDFPAMLRIMLAMLPHVEEVAEAHGMTAFAYEQCHLIDEAEQAAKRALQLRADEPWAQHALAHVMLTRGRTDEGAAFLEGVRAGWTGLNSFMVTHLWWHLVLFYLSQGRSAEALNAYDQQVWAVAKDYSQDQIGAVSLLARIEFSGVDVDDRWRELGERLAARAEDTVHPFLSLQYLYGLARARRPEAEQLLASIASAAETGPRYLRDAWRDIAMPAALGLNAAARGDHEAAVRELGRALPRMIEIGGSHAQRDFFDQVLLESVIRSGRMVRAQQLLEFRRVHDPDGVPLNQRLAQVYEALGLPQQAEQARARAERRLLQRTSA